MSYKKNCIEAIEKLNRRYEEGEDMSCPLCKIYDCCDKKGCPSRSLIAEKDLKNNNAIGCEASPSYISFLSFLNQTGINKHKERRDYWRKRLSLLKKVEAKYFTPSGYSRRAFKEIMED